MEDIETLKKQNNAKKQRIRGLKLKPVIDYSTINRLQSQVDKLTSRIKTLEMERKLSLANRLLRRFIWKSK